MDFNAITEVNASWVFSASSKRERATPELLREIHADAVENAIFYDRMCTELSAIVDREQGKLERRCYTDAEQYKTDTSALCGMYEMLDEIGEKRAHAERIAYQSRVALEGWK